MTYDRDPELCNVAKAASPESIEILGIYMEILGLQTQLRLQDSWNEEMYVG
jgi:hypothetical protein